MAGPDGDLRRENKLVTVVGSVNDSRVRHRLHELKHEGRVEYIFLNQDDMRRRRLRVTTDKGVECQIALPRSQELTDGAILLLSDERAIVVRSQEERWLCLEPRDKASALELGYCAGNLHWRVKFKDERILVALEGPERDYLLRLEHILGSGRARRVEDD